MHEFEICGNVFEIEWVAKGKDYNDFGHWYCPFCGAMFDTCISDEEPHPSLQEPPKRWIGMTSKQLGRKVKQLYSWKRLLDTVEELEKTIKPFMTVEEKSKIHTEKFIISLTDGRLDISVRRSNDQNQLTLNFTNSKDKEEQINESIDPEKTITRRTRLGQRRRVQAHRPADLKSGSRRFADDQIDLDLQGTL